MIDTKVTILQREEEELHRVQGKVPGALKERNVAAGWTREPGTAFLRPSLDTSSWNEPFSVRIVAVIMDQSEARAV